MFKLPDLILNSFAGWGRKTPPLTLEQALSDETARSADRREALIALGTRFPAQRFIECAMPVEEFKGLLGNSRSGPVSTFDAVADIPVPSQAPGKRPELHRHAVSYRDGILALAHDVRLPQSISPDVPNVVQLNAAFLRVARLAGVIEGGVAYVAAQFSVLPGSPARTVPATDRHLQHFRQQRQIVDRSTTAPGAF